MSHPTQKFGMTSLWLGAIALCLAVVVIFGGPFAPVETTGVSLGELAGEMRDSAIRAIQGQEQPAARARPWDIDRFLAIGVGLLAAAAIIAGVIGFVQGEPRRTVLAGVALGAGALTLHFLAWGFLLLIGALLVGYVLQNLTSFFE